MVNRQLFERLHYFNNEIIIIVGLAATDVNSVDGPRVPNIMQIKAGNLALLLG